VPGTSACSFRPLRRALRSGESEVGVVAPGVDVETEVCGEQPGPALGAARQVAQAPVFQYGAGLHSYLLAPHEQVTFPITLTADIRRITEADRQADPLISVSMR
jgi:hypothetical protein